MTAEYRVAVVVDGEYGERLYELARTGPVWIIDTPANRAAAQKLWAERPNVSHVEGVTTFEPHSDCAENALIAELDMIDLHHGSYSVANPYTVLEVVGASPTDKVKAELSEYGFSEFHCTEEGFRAVRLSPLI